jgi:hypothetical protein
MISSPATTRPGRIPAQVRDVLAPDVMKRVRALTAVRDLAPADPDFPPRVIRRGKLTVYLTLDDLVTVIDAAARKGGAS